MECRCVENVTLSDELNSGLAVTRVTCTESACGDVRVALRLDGVVPDGQTSVRLRGVLSGLQQVAGLPLAASQFAINCHGFLFAYGNNTDSATYAAPAPITAFINDDMAVYLISGAVADVEAGWSVVADVELHLQPRR